MLGKILTITKNSAIVEVNKEAIGIKDLINLHVVFEDDNKKILGEIDSIEQDSLKISFLGELTDNDFIGGLIKKPSMDAKIRIINQDELKILTGNEDKSIRLGVSPLYNDYPLNVNLDEFFSNHSAIFGNTGSGKTYGICRIIQNIFPASQIIPYKANFFIFDSYGEYINAFKDLDKNNPYYSFKVITTNMSKNYEKLNIPVCLLDLEDVLNLLDATSFSQIAMVETALVYVKMFARNDKEAMEFKNHILAKAITSIMYTNQTASKIRDQIFEILSETNTPDLSLDTDVPGIGFTRRFRNCFDIDSEGRFAERKIIADYINSFIDDTRKWNFSAEGVSYSLHDLEVALNFTLYSERYLLNESMYDSAMSLKVKLHDLASREMGKFFTSDGYIKLEDYIKKIQINGNKRSQIVNFNLEDVDDRFARTIVKIFGRMFMKFTKGLQNRASYPIHMILEEAHRYVLEGDDKKLFGYNIFERIAKEGRKYGLILDLITQRPTDLNENVISQCTNFLIFKINHPADLEYIAKSVPNMSEDIVEKQKTLQSGTCVAFGRIFKIPMIVKMEKACPPPTSSNCDIYNNWMVRLKQ
ncbi:MAG: ATP-binding protein [Peptoniphilus sp.]|uniref:ATP-binding protein n=1 Tax=Peptoniphilus sp. TaxID=1971214 RepID=UPI0025D4DFF5|nr:ATP-binding protein [Peptoniphilus sp.]MCI5643075.1 ATP-binding protein [Peptoniphilus sp.]MDD6653125.1 ATP-binding protein [Clostridium sp.]